MPSKNQTLFAATWRFGRMAVNTASERLGGQYRPGRTEATPASDELLMDSVEQGVMTVELDPRIDSVGLGGLPRIVPGRWNWMRR